jgi:hypothetical protein
VKRLQGVALAMLLAVTVWSTPNAVKGMEVDGPVILSPTSGAVVALGGSVSVHVDFSKAAFGTYALTVSGGSGNLAEPFVWDGSNARAWVRLGPLDEVGNYVVSIADELGNPVTEPTPFVVHATTPSTRPSAPGSPRASTGSHRATLRWTYTSGDDGGAALIRFQVQRGARSATRLNLSPSSRWHRFTRLTNGTTYRLYVRAQNSVGFSRWVDATATPARRPSAPARARATASSHRARLSWEHRPGGNGGASITAYQVQRGSSRASRTLRSGSARSHLFRGLTNGRTYTFYVRARNRVGYGPWARATARPRGASAAPPPRNCTPGYSPCLPPASDYDCAGGSGNGPRYAHGPIRVTGDDPYDLDRDGDGVACET